MIIELVDPRDIEQEVDQPVYRIYFWHRPAPTPGDARQGMAYHCEEYRLEDALDVDEVIKWATARARPEQTFTLYAEHQPDGRPGLMRLSGRDPSR